MATILTAADLETAVRALIVAEKTNLGIEVTVPVAYGDGEAVSVVVEQKGSELTVHDAGFAAMRLSAYGVSLSRHVNNRLTEYAHRYRCDFGSGRVSMRATVDDAAQAVALVANAARGVADYVYEIRRQAEASKE